MVMSTDEPKEIPKSVVTAYTMCKPVAETDRNSLNSFLVCICLLYPMNCDFVEAVWMKAFFFLEVVQPGFYYF